MDKNKYFTRTGTQQDLPALLGLVKELAAYEKASEEVWVTEATYLEDGFGDKKIFDFIVLCEKENPNEVIGIALFFMAYSTWKGKMLWLDDFVIKEEYRRKGLGKILFDAVVMESKNREVNLMKWQVLDWNDPAIKFYEKYGATIERNWFNGKLLKDQIEEITSKL